MKRRVPYDDGTATGAYGGNGVLPHSEASETPQSEAQESGATQQAEARGGTEKHRFPMKGRANLAMRMLNRAEETSRKRKHGR